MLHNSKIARLLAVFIAITLMGSLLPVHTASGQSGVQAPYIGIWISAQELANLPTSGAAWSALVNAANAEAGSPEIQNHDSDNDVYVLAKALVYARTGDNNFRSQVISQLQQAVGTEAGGRTLALGRNLVSYVIAADLVNLPTTDPSIDQVFRTWLRTTLTETLDGDTLISTHETRPNNWGTHAGASRAAVAWYLGDRTELDRTAEVFKGWVGDRNAYRGFSFGELDWQCKPSAPVGINPMGCTKNGVNIDGALPEELRRAGSFTNPPRFTDYAWEAMQGALVQAIILHRAGYPAFEWSDRAILRAVQYLDRIGWNAESDDKWQPWLINYAYGTSFATSAAGNGKNMGWTDWTHGGRRMGPAQPATPPVVLQAVPGRDALVANDQISVSVQFSQGMNPATITASTFKVIGPKGALPGSIIYYPYTNTATFLSSGRVTSSMTVSVEVTTGIKDEIDRALTSGETWAFDLQATQIYRVRLPITIR